jgi:hypothetical protein
LSAASALTLISPETLAPGAGDVRVTVGGLVSRTTITVTGAEVARLPAASRATAVRVWVPVLAVFVFQVTR